VCDNLLDDLSKITTQKKKKIWVGGGDSGVGRGGVVWVESIVVCQVSVVLSKYESNLMLNKEVMAI